MEKSEVIQKLYLHVKISDLMSSHVKKSDMHYILLIFSCLSLLWAMLKKLLVWHCRPGGSQGGSVDRIFFFLHYKKKLEVSASNPFEMQAKLYAELTDDIFRYYSVPKNSLPKHKTPLSEPLS